MTGNRKGSIYSMSDLENMIIKEQDFEQAMSTQILPFINERIICDTVTVKPGVDLAYQYMIHPDEKAAVVISHGYCEFATKFYEVAYYFYKKGYSVFILEHRGHGYSNRMVKNYSKVHIDHFDTYVKDFDVFIRRVVQKKSNTGKLYLYAHSMGGAIGTLYLEKYPEVFSKAVLSSPMIQMKTGDVSVFVKNVICFLAHFYPLAKAYLPSHHDYDSSYKYPMCSALSEPRYKYQWEERERDIHYQTNGASIRWSREAINVSKKILKNAYSVQIPVILFQASDDHLVESEAQDSFSKLSKNTRLIRVEGSKHEIYNATDAIILDYYREIFEFFE